MFAYHVRSSWQVENMEATRFLNLMQVLYVSVGAGIDERQLIERWRDS